MFFYFSAGKTSGFPVLLQKRLQYSNQTSTLGLKREIQDVSHVGPAWNPGSCWLMAGHRQTRWHSDWHSNGKIRDSCVHILTETPSPPQKSCNPRCCSQMVEPCSEPSERWTAGGREDVGSVLNQWFLVLSWIDNVVAPYFIINIPVLLLTFIHM